MRACSQEILSYRQTPSMLRYRTQISNYKYRNSISYRATSANACLNPWNVVWAAAPHHFHRPALSLHHVPEFHCCNNVSRVPLAVPDCSLHNSPKRRCFPDENLIKSNLKPTATLTSKQRPRLPSPFTIPISVSGRRTLGRCRSRRENTWKIVWCSNRKISRWAYGSTVSCTAYGTNNFESVSKKRILSA